MTINYFGHISPLSKTYCQAPLADHRYSLALESQGGRMSVHYNHYQSHSPTNLLLVCCAVPQGLFVLPVVFDWSCF